MITTIANLFLAGVSIVLPMDSTANGSEIELGEIATITGADQATLDSLRAIEIARTPNPGFTRNITRRDIFDKVRAQAPGLEISFAGRTATRVSLAVQTIGKEEFTQAVDAEIAKLVKGRDVTWTPAKVLGALEVPMGDVTAGEPAKAALEVVLSGADLQTGIMNVTISVKVDGTPYKSVYATWDVKIWEELPVLVRNLPAGTSVSPALFRYQRTVVPSGGVGSILTPAAMPGAITKKTLIAGNVVIETDVTRPTVIHEDDLITLEVVKGEIRAGVQVVALATGSVGDTIRVKRPDSGLEFSAVIKSKFLVELNLDNR
ncbi:MAG: flagella basal body P-ring formation protein FlgA [Planctomycetota bacterium]|jgi:flagella basal body P-ring formation protein FlgA